MNQNQTLSSLSEELQSLMPDDIKNIVQNTAGNIYPEACRTARISLDGFKLNLERYQNKQDRKLHNRVKAFFKNKRKVGVILVILISLIAIFGIVMLPGLLSVEGEAKIGVCMPIALITAIPLAIIWTKMICREPSVGKGILSWFLSYVSLGIFVLICTIGPIMLADAGISLPSMNQELYTPEILQTYGGEFNAFFHEDDGKITFTSCDEEGNVTGYFEYGMNSSYGKYEISGQISKKTKKGDVTLSVVFGKCIDSSVYASPMDFTAQITDSYSRFVCEDYDMDWTVIESNGDDTTMDETTGMQISSVSDLQQLTNSAETYTLKNDIDLTGVSWNPIEGFSGVLDGNGYTIKNLTINTASSNVGFFSTLSGTVKNVKFENAKIIVSGRYENVGILCGTLTGNIESISVSGAVTASMSSNVGGVFGMSTCNPNSGSITISNINNSAEVSALNKVGGAFGYINKTTYNGATVNITNVINTGKISSSGGEYVGGIVGYLYAESQYGSTNVLIDQANNSGEVIGKLHIGGIAGFAQSDDGASAITNAVVNATIKGEAYVGGIAGELVSIAIKDSQNTGSHISATGYTMQGTTKCAYLGGFAGKGYSASNCTNEVELNYTGGGAYVGGIMGLSDGLNMSDLKNNATITGADHVGGIFGRMLRESMNGYTLDFQRFTNEGTVSGNDYVGGIFGSCDVSSQYGAACLIITTFKNQVNITGNAYVGGCIGFGKTDSSESNMMDCSSTGTVTGTSDYGEIAGKLENIKLQ